MIDHEDKCHHCGLCCRLSDEQTDGTVKPAGTACHLYDQSAGRCLNYRYRYIVNPYCLSVEDAMLIGALPMSCGYVQGAKWYKCRVESPEFQRRAGE